ncbi:MAG TPA: site-2 protease family protein, partial [Gemmatimonadales bacterium]
MRWSYRIATIAGTDIKVHVTFLLLVGWWALIGYSQAGPAAALTSALALLALFACVVLHEFGHILMARRFGVRTPDVILLPIGGVARLERIPDEPRQELLIALAGPAVTLAIAVVLFLVLRLSGSNADVSELSEHQPFLAFLVTVN